MTNLESMRNLNEPIFYKDYGFYGFFLSFIGAIGIFLYSIYNPSDNWKEKESGDNLLTLQLSAFAPPSKDKVADEIRKKKHRKRKEHKKKDAIEAPPKPEPSMFEAKKEEPKPKEKVDPKETKEEIIKEADESTTIKSSPDANATQNIKVMRYSEGVDNAFLRAIRIAIEKRHEYPNLASQRGYEGEVLVKFLIDNDGNVSDIRVIHTSNYAILDKAAVKTLKKASKEFPKPDEATYIEIPIAYMLRRG